MLPSSSHQPEPRTLYQTTATTQHKTRQRPHCNSLHSEPLSISDPLQNPIYVHVHDAIIFVEPTTPMDVGLSVGLGLGVPAIVITVAVAVSVLVWYGKKKR